METWTYQIDKKCGLTNFPLGEVSCPTREKKKRKKQLITLTHTDKSIPQLITAVINHTSASCQIDRIPQATLKTLFVQAWFQWLHPMWPLWRSTWFHWPHSKWSLPVKSQSVIPRAAFYMIIVQVYVSPVVTLHVVTICESVCDPSGYILHYSVCLCDSSSHTAHPHCASLCDTCSHALIDRYLRKYMWF